VTTDGEGGAESETWIRDQHNKSNIKVIRGESTTMSPTVEENPKQSQGSEQVVSNQRGANSGPSLLDTEEVRPAGAGVSGGPAIKLSAAERMENHLRAQSARRKRDAEGNSEANAAETFQHEVD